MGTNIRFTFILIVDTGAVYLKHYEEMMHKSLASGDAIVLMRSYFVRRDEETVTEF